MSRNVRKLIDIGANLTDPMFRGIYNSTKKHPDDFIHMLNRSKEQGVEKIIVTGGTLEESKEALKIAQESQNLFSTVGCHPTRCDEFINYNRGPDAYLNEMKDLACNNPSKIVAIGELGLDFDRLHFCTKEVQKTYFEKQLVLAEVTKLPLFLHNRNSVDDFIEILDRNVHRFASAGGVVHSFDGSEKDLKRILDLGLYIGVNGCSLKTERNLEVAKLIPTDRLMIETDCPWCEIKRTHASYKYVKTHFEKTKNASDTNLPIKNRNEPMNLIQVLEVLSALRGEDVDNLAEQIFHNTNKLFFNK